MVTIMRKFKKLYVGLRKNGASYYEAKILVRSFINGNIDKFRAFGGKVVKIYHPSTGRYTTDFDYKGFRFEKAHREYLIQKLILNRGLDPHTIGVSAKVE